MLCIFVLQIGVVYMRAIYDASLPRSRIARRLGTSVCGCCRASAEAFISSTTKHDVIKNHLEPVAHEYTEVLFNGTVLKDMDSMFRRSGVQSVSRARMHGVYIICCASLHRRAKSHSPTVQQLT